MKSVLAILALLAATSAHAEENLLIPALALQLADYGQTLGISESCRAGGEFHETNPILGNCPNKADVSKYFATTTAIMVAAHYLLPKEYAKWSDRVWVAVEVGAVANNVAIGVKFGF